MSANRFRTPPSGTDPVPTHAGTPPPKQRTMRFKMGRRYGNETSFVAENVPFFVYLALLGVVYIFNSQYALRMVKEISTLQEETKELRWHLYTAKSDLMYRTKLTEMSRMLEGQGLAPPSDKPYRLRYP